MRSTAHQALQTQVARLETVFRDIAATRMEGVPLLHASLQVQAVDFAPEPEGDFALGVLVTPWFMNLMRLPWAPPRCWPRAGGAPAPGGTPAALHRRARGGVWRLRNVLARLAHVRVCRPASRRGHGA